MALPFDIWVEIMDENVNSSHISLITQFDILHLCNIYLVDSSPFNILLVLQILCFRIISSVESQKDAITIQRCSVENQKGAIIINFVQR